MEALITENIISVLIRLHTEAKAPNISPRDFTQRGLAISGLLEKVERDFSLKYMIGVYVKACQRVGQTISPLKPATMRKLEDNGFTLKKVTKAVCYEK